MSGSTVIRGAVAEGADGERVSRLAMVARSHPPEGLILLAEAQGDPVAAIGIFDGHAISDPRRSTLGVRMRLRLLRIQIRLILTVRGI
jgi:hypothetical protein